MKFIITFSLFCNNVFFILSRVFLALSDDPKDRGILVAEGGGKVSFRN